LRRRPLLRALLVSLAVHVAAVALLVHLARASPQSARTPVRFSIIHLPPIRLRPPPDRSRETAERPRRPRPSPSGAPPSGQAVSPDQPNAPPTAAKPEQHAPAADAPLELFPRGAISRGAGPISPDGSGASTGRDVPDSPEVEARTVKRRIEIWRRDSLAERQVAVGVDDYFKTYRHALEEGMGTPPSGGGPKHGEPSAGQRWVNAWLDALAEADPSREPAERGERMPNRSIQDVSGRMDEFLHNQLGPMATLPSPTAFRLVKRAVSRGIPVAVLRIVQRADGTIASTELIASSGDKKFDAYVLEHAALALAAVPAPPTRQGAGLHPDGTRTDWAFFRNGPSCGVILLRVY
jgi:hypothetical protein